MVSWGQFAVAWARSRWASEVLVDSGMAGMNDIMPLWRVIRLAWAVFGCMIGEVATQEPYASARWVFWVVDNGPPTEARPRGRPPRSPLPPRGHGSTPRCTHPG